MGLYAVGSRRLHVGFACMARFDKSVAVGRQRASPPARIAADSAAAATRAAVADCCPRGAAGGFFRREPSGNETGASATGL
eukprot:177381-Chlamydomonas_euryale.AAC.6